MTSNDADLTNEKYDDQKLDDENLVLAEPIQQGVPEKEENEIEAPNDVQKSPTTPLPWGQLFVVFLTFALDNFNFSTLAPYIGFMVADFHLVEDGDERKIGYYAGLLGSSYYVTQLFFAFLWGWLSDKYGRRPIILMGIVGSCITSLLFGFSTNIYWAMTTRMLLGALNGNVGVLKTYIGEVTDKTNQAKAFSYVGMSFSSSMIIGPLIGGFLARPVAQYPSLFAEDSAIKSFLTQFPYVLPNLVVFIMCVIGLITSLIFIKESNQAVLQRRAAKSETSPIENDNIELLETNPKNDEALDNEIAYTPSTTVIEASREEEQLRDLEIACELEDDVIRLPFFPNKSFHFPKWWPKNDILRTRSPIISCLLYAILGLVTIAFQEIIPLWVYNMLF